MPIFLLASSTELSGAVLYLAVFRGIRPEYAAVFSADFFTVTAGYFKFPPLNELLQCPYYPLRELFFFRYTQISFKEYFFTILSYIGYLMSEVPSHFTYVINLYSYTINNFIKNTS